jgi:uncharacterized protein (TIRG00374 family)
VNVRLIRQGLKYGIGFAVLAFMIWWYWKPGQPSGLAAIWQKHAVEGQPVHWLPFALALACCTAAVLLSFVRWYFLVRAQGLVFSLHSAVRLGLLGYSFNTLLPGTFGGDVVKAVLMGMEQERRAVAVATVIFDRLIGTWGLCWLVVLTGWIFWGAGSLDGPGQEVLRTITLTATMILGVSLLAWWVLGLIPSHRAEHWVGRLERLRFRSVAVSLAEFWRAAWIYRVKGWYVWLAVFLAIVGHVGFVLTFYFAALTIMNPDEIPSLAAHFLIVPIGLSIQAGLPTPSGLGLGEIVFGSLYELVGYPAALGFAATVVRRPITWTLALVGFLVALLMRPESATRA